MAVGIYFGLRPLVGSEEVGWMCILGAAPFAACGFFKYHGMTAEKLAWAWFKSEFLYPKKLVFKSDSLYYDAMKDAIAEGEKPPRKTENPQAPATGWERTVTFSFFALKGRMPIIKTLLKATKLEKEKFKIPKSVQDAIPIQRIWPDGIFQVGSRFSKTFFFTDINYSIASKEDKTAMFIDYSELLNALDSGASAKITINNRRVDKAEFEKSLLLPMKEDGLDHFRKEYNEMLLSKVTGTNNSVVQDRYITITVAKKTIDEARTYFARVGTDLITHLSQLSSIGRELDAAARLQIFRDFFKGGEPAAFAFDLKEHMKKGHSFKDWLCPDSMEFQKDHFRLNDRWGRVLYLQGYASYIKDSMIAELCDMDRSLMLSIDILPVPTDEAVREIQNKLLGVETNAANWQRKQNAANNFSAVLPYDMEQQRKETKEMLDDLTNRDQRMMFGLVTLVHLADTKEQLDSDTETLLTTRKKASVPDERPALAAEGRAGHGLCPTACGEFRR